MVLTRSTFNYKPRPRSDEALLARIREIALTRVRHGYWRIYACSGGKVGMSITSAYTGSTSLKGSISGVSGLVATGQQLTAWNGLRKSDRTRPGVWTSWPMRSSTGGDSAP